MRQEQNMRQANTCNILSKGGSLSVQRADVSFEIGHNACYNNAYRVNLETQIS